MVSGSVSSPNRGSSHLSLALLFTIGCQGVFSLRGWTLWIQSGFHVAGPTRVPLGRSHKFQIRDCHPLWYRIPTVSSIRRFCNFTMRGPTTPQAVACGLGCFLFARRYWGNRVFFLLLQILRCFSSLRSFWYPGINACLTTSPGLSQPSTP